MHALNPDLAQHKVLYGCLIQQRAFCACSSPRLNANCLQFDCSLNPSSLVVGWECHPELAELRDNIILNQVSFILHSLKYFILFVFLFLTSFPPSPQKFPLHFPPPVPYLKELPLPTWSVCVAFTKDVSSLSQPWSRALLWYREIRIIL